MARFAYDIVARTRAGTERLREYGSDDPLGPGDVVFLDGRYWLVERAEPDVDDRPARLVAEPARYRIRLHHPDGREEIGPFRRFRPDAPRLGHAFTTTEDGRPASWQVVDEQLTFDEQNQPYLDLRAERDFAEVAGELTEHELEHAREQQLPGQAAALLRSATDQGLLIELVALEPGEDPDWAEAERYVDALILEEIEDDLVELCGVDPRRDPRETWLTQVKERLLSDLRLFRADVEGDHDMVEEWEFQGGRVFATVGSYDDEASPDSGHGWMCRLVDAGALAAAGFARVRKAELDVVG